MNIGKWDVMVLVVMSLAVVSMSFVMPTLGLSDPSATENDVPTLNISSERFNLVGDAPPFPNNPTSGTLWYNTTRDPAFSENQIWLAGNGGSDGDADLTLIQNPTSGDARITLTEYNGTGVKSQDQINLDTANNSTTGVLTTDAYTVAIETTDSHNPPDYLAVSWNVDRQPATDNWLGRLPVVGGILSTADAVASVVGWGFTWIIWFMTFIVEFALNAIGAIYDASAYFLGILAWLVTEYATVVTSAPGWAGIFVAVPGIILSATVGKFVVVFIKLLPTT